MDNWIQGKYLIGAKILELNTFIYYTRTCIEQCVLTYS